MQLLTYLAVLCASAGTLSSAMPAVPKAERAVPPVTNKALAARGLGSDPLIPNPQISQVILYAAALIIFGNLFGIEIEGDAIPNLPPPPTGPQVPVVVGGPGAAPLIALLRNRFNNGIGGDVRVTTSLLMGGRPVVYQLALQPVPGLTWSHIAEQAGGFQNLQAFIEDNVQQALVHNLGRATFSLVVPTHGNPQQGVQVAVLHWVMVVPPQ